MKELIAKLRMQPLTKLDWYILMLLCIVTIGIASYDFYKLSETRQSCLTDCNNHWVKEFETKCQGIWSNKDYIPSLVYDINKTVQSKEQNLVMDGIPSPNFEQEITAIKLPLS